MRSSLLIGNAVLLVAVGIFVFANRTASQTVRTSTINSATQLASSSQTPLDQLSSAEIAAQVALVTRLSEATAVRNQADSENAQLAIVPSDASIVAKPQVVATSQKSKRDIARYKVQPGETLSSIAAKYGLKPESVRWSNGLSGDKVDVNKELLIPPADGIVYQVKSGDTIDAVSSRFQAQKNLFVTVNDAESGSLVVGEHVWVPNGVLPAVATSAPRFSAATYDAYAFGFSPSYGSNGYDYGYCTWYAAKKRAAIGRPIPSNLGNAITWKTLAARAGFGVGTTPAAGAVIWTPASYGYGHVGYVERINEDGSVWVSDMNSRGFAAMDTSSGGAGGWGRISFKLLSPAQASGYWYIY